MMQPDTFSSHQSPFLNRHTLTHVSSLAILHLRRDQLTPLVLSEIDDEHAGYEEGKVINTRFGSYPHSTLIGIPWGSQVRASKVDTGSRGRKSSGQKRKRGNAETGLGSQNPLPDATIAVETQLPKVATSAQTGFAHLLPPTPETWTISLPHRTQVVYTPDYSYILQRLKARPGTQIIEAGAGSGSFSHAAVRAIYNGPPGSGLQPTGKVWSFEFHEQRAEKLIKELREHCLSDIIEVNRRDVYNGGFTVKRDDRQLVQAKAVFLDLPAPWLALPHLKRRIKTTPSPAKIVKSEPGVDDVATKNEELPEAESSDEVGPLSLQAPVHICCFLPCIEQVQRTVASLQFHAWQLISVVEVDAHRIEIRRERVGIAEEGLKGVNASAATVEEAMVKLRDDESRTQAFHQINQRLMKGNRKSETDRGGVKTKQERLQGIQEAVEQRQLYKEGRLVHRAEPELKVHTSYLIFATLPREWTEEDEAKARHQWTQDPKKENEVEDAVA